jgi:hypothetical protein
MTAGEHESVAIYPPRISWIVTQEAAPEQIRSRGERHWSAGVTRLSLFDGVHGESAYGVDASPGQLGSRISLTIVGLQGIRPHDSSAGALWVQRVLLDGGGGK